MKKLYNILIILNDGYFDLGKIFLNSFYKNCNLDKVNKIYIGDTGLNDKNQIFLKTTYNKVEIINTGYSTKNNTIHSKDWVKSVSQKTRLLLDLAKIKDETIILMDVDMVILDDFSHIIDTDYDIQVCKRENPAKRAPVIDKNYFILKYIASFLVINNKNSIQFLESWIEKMHFLINKKIIPPFETPALCLVIEDFKNIIKIADIDERIVSCSNNYYSNLTNVIHNKSTDGKRSYNNVKERLKGIKNFDHDLIYDFLEATPITQPQK